MARLIALLIFVIYATCASVVYGAVPNYSKPVRLLHADLDYLHDEDVAQRESNISSFVDRVKNMGVNTVFLQAYAEPEAGAPIREMYYENPILPVRSNIFPVVASLLRKNNIVVFAWMPVHTYNIGEHSTHPRVTYDRTSDTSRPEHIPPTGFDQDWYLRLSPFVSTNVEAIEQLFISLVKSTTIDGVLYHDDAVFGMYEDSNEAAIKYYNDNGVTGSTIAEIYASESNRQKWTTLKGQVLYDLTDKLTKTMRDLQPDNYIQTSRSMYASIILEPRSEEWFAQNMAAFYKHYDWNAPMAMPLMEQIDDPVKTVKFFEDLIKNINTIPNALSKTIFELQALDWRKGDSVERFIDTKIIGEWMDLLQKNKAFHFGYYPDDVFENHPKLSVMKPYITKDMDKKDTDDEDSDKDTSSASAIHFSLFFGLLLIVNIILL